MATARMGTNAGGQLVQIMGFHHIIIGPMAVLNTGFWARVVDAAGYSLAGFKRLSAKPAARLEITAATIVAVAFVWRGAAAWHWGVMLVLFSLVLVVEALNTAIEVLTDRISPHWPQMAKDAKDLGSLAVGLMLVVSGAFAGLVIVGVL